MLIQVMKQSGANTVRVAEGLKEAQGKLEADHPDLKFTVITDQYVFINQSIGSMGSSGIIGGVLAIAVLWLFLRNISSLLIVGLSIPVSIIASFVLVYLSNLSLNLMTLGGMALGVGMLVDSSIVVLENVFRHLTEQPTRNWRPERCWRDFWRIDCLHCHIYRSLLPIIFWTALPGSC